MRSVVCTDTLTGQPAQDESVCDDEKPEHLLVCNTAACITYFWKVGSWSVCNKDCDTGQMTRTVQCLSSEGDISDNSQVLSHLGSVGI